MALNLTVIFIIDKSAIFDSFLSLVYEMSITSEKMPHTSQLQEAIMTSLNVFCLTGSPKTKVIHFTKRSRKFSHLRSWKMTNRSIFHYFSTKNDQNYYSANWLIVSALVGCLITLTQMLFTQHVSSGGGKTEWYEWKLWQDSILNH